MTIDPMYVVYSGVQTLVTLVSLLGAFLYTYWYIDTRQRPTVQLRWLLIIIAALCLATFQTAARWVLLRAMDIEFAANVYMTISDSRRAYSEYVFSQGFTLLVVSALVVPIWMVRRHSTALLAGIFASIAMIGVVAASYHQQRLSDYCAMPLHCSRD